MSGYVNIRSIKSSAFALFKQHFPKIETRDLKLHLKVDSDHQDTVITLSGLHRQKKASMTQLLVDFAAVGVTSTQIQTTKRAGHLKDGELKFHDLPHHKNTKPVSSTTLTVMTDTRKAEELMNETLVYARLREASVSFLDRHLGAMFHHDIKHHLEIKREGVNKHNAPMVTLTLRGIKAKNDLTSSTLQDMASDLAEAGIATSTDIQGKFIQCTTLYYMAAKQLNEAALAYASKDVRLPQMNASLFAEELKS